MTGKRCVYTVLTGGYEELLEQPTSSNSAIDYICFTDDPRLSSSTWEARTFSPPFPSDPSRSSRFPKILAHRFLADYDTSLYIDNSVLLRQPAEKIFDELLPSNRAMAGLSHSYRKTVEDEFTAVIEGGYERSFVCREQLEHYRKNRPDVLALRPILGGFLLRRHHDPQLQSAMESWWWHVLRYSGRDQLSMMMALHEARIDPAIHELDNFESVYHEWPHSTGRARSTGSRLLSAARILGSNPDGSLATDGEESKSLIADLIRQMERQKVMLDDLEVENEHRLRVIKDLQGEADHRQKVIDEVASEAAHRQKVIDEVAGEAAHRQKVIDELAAEAAHRLNVIEDLAKVAEQRLESLNEMTKERGELAERVEGLTTELDRLKTAIDGSRVMRWLLRRRLGREDE